MKNIKNTVNAIETTVKCVFTVCGFIVIGFVVLITVFLIINGLPAIKEIGFCRFLFQHKMGVHCRACIIRNTAVYNDLGLRNIRCSDYRCTDRHTVCSIYFKNSTAENRKDSQQCSGFIVRYTRLLFMDFLV